MLYIITCDGLLPHLLLRTQGGVVTLAATFASEIDANAMFAFLTFVLHWPGHPLNGEPANLDDFMAEVQVHKSTCL